MSSVSEERTLQGGEGSLLGGPGAEGAGGDLQRPVRASLGGASTPGAHADVFGTCYDLGESRLNIFFSASFGKKNFNRPKPHPGGFLHTYRIG